MGVSSRQYVLVIRAGSFLCALPLGGGVREVMRPLATEPLPDAPSFLRGRATIRGARVRVIHLGSLLGSRDAGNAKRLVLLGVGGKHIAIVVESVLRLRELEAGVLHSLPSLLAQIASDLVTTLSVHDRHLLVALEGARMIPDGLWQELDSTTVAP